MKSIILFSIVIFLCSIQSLFAQNENRRAGLIFDDEAYNQVPHLPKYEGKKYNEIPIRVSLKDFCPTPGDQGENGSCVGWAVGYSGLTICNAVKDDLTNQTEINKRAKSASYIYNQILDEGDDCTAGARMTDALILLKEKGDCLASQFDGMTNDCNDTPNQALHETAEQFKIKDYAAVFSYLEDAKVKIDKTRKSLIAKKPVIIGMNITPSFWNIEQGQQIWEIGDDEEIIGGHAMVVVGYDEVLKSFELMNSWGANFGDGGFVWVSYDDFAKNTKYGFEIILDDKTTIEKGEVLVEKGITAEEDICILELEGAFVFRYPSGYEKGDNGQMLKDDNGNPKIQFKEAKTELSADGTHYELARKDWKVGDIFQLLARNIPSGKSVYVFSVDANNKLEKHWPKAAMKIFDPEKDAFSSVPLSTYLPSEDAEIIIPAPDSALQLDAEGEDHLCVLYSDIPITDFERRITKLTSTSGDFKTQLHAGFGDLLIEKQQVTYASNEMTFDCSAEEGTGIVVPIILTVAAH